MYITRYSKVDEQLGWKIGQELSKLGALGRVWQHQNNCVSGAGVCRVAVIEVQDEFSIDYLSVGPILTTRLLAIHLQNHVLKSLMSFIISLRDDLFIHI